MKNLILSVSLLFTTSMISAQDFNYFDNNPEWWMSAYSANGTGEIPIDWQSNFVYYIDGDSIVDELEYFKVHTRGTSQYIGEISQYFDVFELLVRQDGKKIYSILPNENTEVLTYDFDYYVGDTLDVTYFIQEENRPIIESIDSVLINDNYHRIFTFTDAAFEPLVEGIGHRLGFFLAWPYTIVNGGSTLHCYFQNGDYQYSPYEILEECSFYVTINENTLENDYLLAPNPASNIVILGDAQVNFNSVIKLKNSMGQEVLNFSYSISECEVEFDVSQLDSGMYLIIIDQEIYRLLKN